MRHSIRATAAIIALAAAAPAIAQDDYSNDEDWTGIYVGGALGLGWSEDEDGETIGFDNNGDGTFSDTVRTGTGADAFSPGFCSGAAVRADPVGGCSDIGEQGTDWAAHIGFDYDLGGFVVGAVFEGGMADVQDNVAGFTTTPADYTLTRELRENAALRARIGYAFGDTLAYATGGGAYGRFRNSFRSRFNTLNQFTVEDEDREGYGYTYGGGIEQRIGDNFSIGVLYRYTTLQDDDSTVLVTRGAAAATNAFVNPATTNGQTRFQRTEEDFDYHSVKVTASFRF